MKQKLIKIALKNGNCTYLKHNANLSKVEISNYCSSVLGNKWLTYVEIHKDKEPNFNCMIGFHNSDIEEQIMQLERKLKRTIKYFSKKDKKHCKRETESIQEQIENLKKQLVKIPSTV